MIHLRLSAAIAVLFVSTGLAFADSPTPAGNDGFAHAALSADRHSGGAGAGAKFHGSTAVIAGGAAVGGGALIHDLFKGSSRTAVRVPEISSSGMIAGLILLMGGGLIIRGRQQVRS